MSSLSPDQASQLLADDYKNLEAKVRKGKALTNAERQFVRARATGDTSGDLNITTARTVVELANALGVNRRSIGNWRKIEGAPSATANGTHDVVAWREFMKAKNLNGAAEVDEETLKYRKLAAEVEDRELRVAVRKGEFISKDEVRRSWMERAGRVTSIMRAKFEKELPPLLLGLDAPSIAEKLAQAVDEILAELHENKADSLTP